LSEGARPAPAFNLADLFEGVVDAVPERVALALPDRRLTYAELEARANRLAHHLLAAGVGPGDHVGTYLRNGTEYVEAMLAAFKVRAVPVNVNYRYVADELRALFRDAELVALVHGAEFASRVAEVADGVPTLRHVLEVGPDYEAALAARPADRDFAPRSGGDRHVIYTGGTTGTPRGVVWRHEDLFFAGMAGGNPTARGRAGRWSPSPSRP
jgi:3-oxocholest-4-en-26-oate---CoA ligase